MAAMTESQALFLSHCIASPSIAQCTFRVDYYAASDRPKYIGCATCGTAENTANWRIIKCNYDGTDLLIDVKVAHCVTWTDRASATYA